MKLEEYIFVKLNCVIKFNSCKRQSNRKYFT